MKKQSNSNIKTYVLNAMYGFLLIMIIASMCVVFIIPGLSSETSGIWKGPGMIASSGIALLIFDFLAIIAMIIGLVVFKKTKNQFNINKKFNIACIIGLVDLLVLIVIAIMANPEWFSGTISGMIMSVNLLLQIGIFSGLLGYSVTGIVLLVLCLILTISPIVFYGLSYLNKKPHAVAK